MISEQFIQDAICRPDRLAKVLRDIGKEWRFVTDGEKTLRDVINQEVNFPAGRIDVLGTFEQRQHLVIVEVKAGKVGLDAVTQLAGYLDRWRDLPLPEMRLEHVKEPVGILLAEGFVNIPEVRSDIRLVSFNLQSAWPFDRVEPKDTLQSGDEEALVATRAAKQSQLVNLDDHTNYILEDTRLRPVFASIANCFLDPADERLEWVCVNPQGQHVAVHYKGEYIIHLWARRRYFYVGYPDSGESGFLRIGGPDSRDLARVSEGISKRLNQIDQRMAEAIGDFRWSDG